jgi:hypothetical protein
MYLEQRPRSALVCVFVCHSRLRIPVRCDGRWIVATQRTYWKRIADFLAQGCAVERKGE